MRTGTSPIDPSGAPWAVLALARALREQIDRDYVEDKSSSSPFARAFFTLVEGLGIVEAPNGRAAA